jgi:division protein CdvB (Snf7/Vps24/ESCRT-III family)
MTTQSYDSALELVKERLEQIDKIKNKFSGFPEVLEKLKNVKDTLIESEKELIILENYNKS